MKHNQLIYHCIFTCPALPQKPAPVVHMQLYPFPFMFRDLAVPYFRPVPFRNLDHCSVPFREIATTYLCVTFVRTHPASLSSQTILPSRAYETQCLCYVLLGNVYIERRGSVVRNCTSTS